MTKVFLRTRKVSKGRVSFYLDFYPPIINPQTGKPTRRESLNIYNIEKPKTAIERSQNNENKHRARLLANKRTNELAKPEIYSQLEREQFQAMDKQDQSFIEFYRKEVVGYTDSSLNIWRASFDHFEEFAKTDKKFSEITTELLEDYKAFLNTWKNKRGAYLSINTRNMYFSKLKTALRKAFKLGYMNKDLSAMVSAMPIEETSREWLSDEEAQKLFSTPCESDVLRRAAIFSYMTGMRFSDVEKLVWGELMLSDGTYYVKFRQQKTKGLEMNPIHQFAYDLTEGPTDPKDASDKKRVFTGLDRSLVNRLFGKWVEASGIQKNITFHCLRHSFAVKVLSETKDFMMVRDLLGHKDIKTTMVYAKVMPENKKQAISKLNFEFINIKVRQ